MIGIGNYMIIISECTTSDSIHFDLCLRIGNGVEYVDMTC